MFRTTVLALFSLGVLTPPAAAQSDYPNRPVRIVVPAHAGGGPDLFARMIGQYFSQKLGQPFVIDNRPGGGSQIGLEHAAGSAPDGYTLVLTTAGVTTLHVTRKSMRYDVRKAFAPIVQVAVVPQAVVVHPGVPAKSVQEFITLAKKEGGNLNFGSPGLGSGPHMTMELFMHSAGIKIQQVHYRGTAGALSDVLAGHLTGTVVDTINAKSSYQTGEIRILGVTTSHRLDVMPDVPAIAEALPGFEAQQWFGLLAPANTPQPIIDKLYKVATEGLSTPEMKKRLDSGGAYHVPHTSAEFGALINREFEQWSTLAKSVNLLPSD